MVIVRESPRYELWAVEITTINSNAVFDCDLMSFAGNAVVLSAVAKACMNTSNK